jgi:hypothetical protein
MKKQLQLLGTILLISISLTGIRYWWNPGKGPRLRVENYPQVKVGMSLAEVEDLLGGPAGHYGRVRSGSISTVRETTQQLPEALERAWCDDWHCLEIAFDGQDRVVRHTRRFGPDAPVSPEGTATRLWGSARRWLGL